MTSSFLLSLSIRYNLSIIPFFHPYRNKTATITLGLNGGLGKVLFRIIVKYMCIFVWRSAVGTTVCGTVAERRSLLQLCTTNSVADFRHTMYSECIASAWERVAGRHCGAETARTKGKLLAWAGNKLVAGRPRTHHLANLGVPVIIIGPAG